MPEYVCKGEVISHPGYYWGCNRRFAKARDLGQHLRSEAGQNCILLPGVNLVEAGAFGLPVGLLTQQPALQNIDWSRIPVEEEAGDLVTQYGFFGNPSSKSDYETMLILRLSKRAILSMAQLIADAGGVKLSLSYPNVMAWIQCYANEKRKITTNSESAYERLSGPKPGLGFSTKLQEFKGSTVSPTY